MSPAPDLSARERLMPCPFCGGPVEIVQIGNEATRSRGFEVRCLTWACATKKRAMVIRNSLEKAREFAIANWNRRAHPPPNPGLVEALEALSPFAEIAAQADEEASRGDEDEMGEWDSIHLMCPGGDLGDLPYRHFRRAASVHAKLSGPTAPTPGALGEER